MAKVEIARAFFTTCVSDRFSCRHRRAGFKALALNPIRQPCLPRNVYAAPFSRETN
jgi:hypothetical protein